MGIASSIFSPNRKCEAKATPKKERVGRKRVMTGGVTPLKESYSAKYFFTLASSPERALWSTKLPFLSTNHMAGILLMPCSLSQTGLPSLAIAELSPRHFVLGHEVPRVSFYLCRRDTPMISKPWFMQFIVGSS